MNKVAVVALCACFSVQAEASVSAYLRAAAVGALTNSDFDMSYSVDTNKFASANPSANNNKHSIGNVGGEFALGFRTKFKNDWFLGGEVNYCLKKVKHNHDFTEIEDNEGITIIDTEKCPISNLNISMNTVSLLDSENISTDTMFTESAEPQQKMWILTTV